MRTAAGPGGQAGPLRVDLAGRFAGSCIRPYTEAEARQAFQRMEAQHRSVGWAPAGGGGVAAATQPTGHAGTPWLDRVLCYL